MFIASFKSVIFFFTFSTLFGVYKKHVKKGDHINSSTPTLVIIITNNLDHDCYIVRLGFRDSNRDSIAQQYVSVLYMCCISCLCILHVLFLLCFRFGSRTVVPNGVNVNATWKSSKVVLVISLMV